jgi:hypothetical protein
VDITNVNTGDRPTLRTLAGAVGAAIRVAVLFLR